MPFILRCGHLVAPKPKLVSTRNFSRAIATTTGRTYNDAIDALNTLQTPWKLYQARMKAGIRPDESFVREMKAYLRRIGYTPSDLNRLNIIHVAGTKGKGSTCAFVDSILSRHRALHSVPRKTGLFISPHLIAVRERIRINSLPISEALFAKYFFEVWDRLEDTAAAAEENAGEAAVKGSKPTYARYLTLMSWHAFLQENVDISIYETGIGGEYDATNLVEKPLASGITTLGIDHVFALGDTQEKIAWHKAGIMKTGSPAFTVEQPALAAKVLEDRATEKDVDLKVLDIDPRLVTVKIRPDATFQKKNATLAIALAETALRQTTVTGDLNESPLPQAFIEGLEGVVFRGRCEVKTEESVVWHVDGAHTADSLKESSKWFVGETANREGPRAMIFNQQGRSEAIDFLDSIHEATKRAGKPAFDQVIFCTNVTYAKTGYKRDFVNNQFDDKEVKELGAQRRFAEKWASLDPQADIKVLPTIEEALETVRGLGKAQVNQERELATVDAYVTGSLHLVGGALGILENVDAL